MAPTSWLPRSLTELFSLISPRPRTWLVGGAVRDAVLGRPLVDLDFVVDGDALVMARRVADRLGADYYPLDPQRGTGRVIQQSGEGSRRTLDFSSLRAADIEADLRARDFTINAMAVALDDPERLLDPTGGIQDLKDKTLRACSPRSISDDPVRALRAVRLATEFNLHMEPTTVYQAGEAAATLAAVSPERSRDEFMRMLDAARPGRSVRLLDHLGLLAVLCPELKALRGLLQPPPHALDAWDHTLAVVDRLGDLLGVLGPVHDEEAAADLVLGQAVVRLGRFRRPISEHLDRSLSEGRRVRQLLFFAALYHDAGKPSTRTVEPDGRIRFLGHEQVGGRMAAERGRALRLSHAEVERLSNGVLHHMRPALLEAAPSITSRAIYRFFRRTGDAGVDAVLLSLADFLATYDPPPPHGAWARRLDACRLLLEAYFEWPRENLEPKPLVRGDDLASALGLDPGPTIGWLLERVREAQAVGEVSTRGQAIEVARKALQARERGEIDVQAEDLGE